MESKFYFQRASERNAKYVAWVYRNFVVWIVQMHKESANKLTLLHCFHKPLYNEVR
jgi:hypothetical protein